jgi:hypothetical protein
MRNDVSCKVSFRLGQLVAGGELDAGIVLVALRAIAAGWPNTAHTFDTINRSFRAGRERPCSAPQRKCSAPLLTFDPNAPLGRERIITIYDQPIGDVV